VLSKLDLKKKTSILGKKVFTSWIRTYDLKSAALPIELYGCGFDGMLLEFFPHHHLQPTAECKLATASTRGGKLEGGRGRVYGIKQLVWQCWQFQAS